MKNFPACSQSLQVPVINGICAKRVQSVCRLRAECVQYRVQSACAPRAGCVRFACRLRAIRVQAACITRALISLGIARWNGDADYSFLANSSWSCQKVCILASMGNLNNLYLVNRWSELILERIFGSQLISLTSREIIGIKFQNSLEHFNYQFIYFPFSQKSSNTHTNDFPDIEPCEV